ncbi:hypothetical protein [Sutcliffiella horikoshii]|uniref:DUF4829 domain-containing protein n=1 Tax=Sutcliffiella horikoshii TaxID=79883 RepID=A0A5D4T333_9BACI|nr:hypothetical protein [Sutcliffiella horikoshii]TYS70013.1 hypothetical protein FZC75_15345 [Sutcliffiella horikoshii]
MKKRRGNQGILLVLGLGVFLFLIYFVAMWLLGEERKAKNLVQEFYTYESSSNYGESWELLHSELQTRFARGAYAQDRAHVFNGHFGADTFSFEIGDSKKISNWKMEKDGESFDTVYEFEVRQDYRGKYGHFLFVQYVYVVQEDKEWRILWDYKK